MKSVIQMFWRICLLRQSPAYVPTQGWFVASVVAANLLTSVIVSVSLDESADALETITRVVVSLAMFAGLVWLATFLREVPARFPGTLTALFGCDLMITAVFGVLVPIGARFGDGVLNVLQLGYFVWSLTVAGFILSRALDVRVGIGILIAFGMLVLQVAAGQTAIGG